MAIYIASRALLFAGVAVVVICALGALAVRRVYKRLHFITPITSVGIPLIGISLSVVNGAGLTTAGILFIVFLLAVSGPIQEIATGRLAGQREGLLREESPQ